MEAAAKLLFGDDEAPRMMNALTTARDLEERRRSPVEARGATRRAVNRARLLAPSDDRGVSTCASWDWSDGGERVKRVSSLCNLSHSRGGSVNGGVNFLPGGFLAPNSPLTPLEEEAGREGKRPRRGEDEIDADVDADADVDVDVDVDPAAGSSQLDIARARDAAEAAAKAVARAAERPGEGRERDDLAPETERPGEGRGRVDAARKSRRDEDSDAMRALRRQWDAMQNPPTRIGDGDAVPGAGGASAEDASERADARKARGARTLKARLAEVLIPTRHPATGNWTFDARVTGLNLANASIGPEGATFLAKALHGRRNADGSWVFNGTLRSLNLEFNSIGDEGVVAIADALSPRWVAADEFANPASGVSAAASDFGLSGRWVCNAALRDLNLNFCDVGPAGAAALARALAPRVGPDGRWTYHGGIANLSLFHNHIGPEGARALAEAIRPRLQPETGEPACNPTLRSLNVGRNQLGDAGLAHVARAFAPVRDAAGEWTFAPAFERLHANMNICLSQEGPLALGEAFSPRRNPDGAWAFAPGLSTLHLANVLLGEEGARAVAKIIAPRPAGADDGDWAFPSNLRALNLSRTGLGDAGAAAVAEAIAPRRTRDGRWVHNPRLRELHLGGATVGPEGTRALAGALAPRRGGDAWYFNAALRVLDLRDNFAGAEGMEALAAAVAPVPYEPREDEIDEGDGTYVRGVGGGGAGGGGGGGAPGAAVAGAASPATPAPAAPAAPAAPPDGGFPFLPFGSPPDSKISGVAPNGRVWIANGGGLAVLNLEFNDGGAEGIAAIADAISPRWSTRRAPSAPPSRAPPPRRRDRLRGTEAREAR